MSIVDHPEYREQDDIGVKLAVLESAVDGYHKEKTQCRETCIKFGERIGNLESADAVNEEARNTMKDDIRSIRESVIGLQGKVFTIIGIGIGINALIVIAAAFLVR